MRAPWRSRLWRSLESPTRNQAADGAFYGTNFDGGGHGSGTVFKITSGGTFALLYSFGGSADGAGPHGAHLVSMAS